MVAKKYIVSLATFCLLVELFANLVRFAVYVVDPASMWGTFPVEVSLFLDKGEKNLRRDALALSHPASQSLLNQVS